MNKSLNTNPALRRTVDHYALRAHLVLDTARYQPMTINQAGELGCYLETAWQGACRAFKSPPVRLGQAKAIMIILLGQCYTESDTMIVTEEQWHALREGVNCADGVWQRLPAGRLLATMQSIRQDMNHER